MEKGFSLIEILIAIVILSLGIFPFMDVINQSTKSTVDGKRRFIASHYSRELIQEIKLKRFDEEKNNPGSWSDIGSDTGESTANGRLEDWNDIDDYHGYTEKNTGILDINEDIYDENYYRKVWVYYVDDDTLEELESGKSNTKKVIVRCFSSDNNEEYSEIIWYIKQE
ncbi:MAG: type IV pilus modification PilV family protein [Fusobacteriota bacterium]